MLELFTHCDFATGIISIDTLDELARQYFQVAMAPGRKREEINGDTIRNAFRTIKKARPEHFIFSSVNQRIIIEMPFMRALYQQFHSKTEEVAVVKAIESKKPTPLISIEELDVLSAELAGEDVPDVASASNQSIKDLNNINNNNNNTHHLHHLFPQKLPISNTFFPNQDTQLRAMALGYEKVTSLVEIQNFIDYNTAIGSRFADFNPIFVKWLSQGTIRQQQTVSIESRRIRDVRRNPTKIHTKRPTERVKDALCNSGFSYCEETKRFSDDSGANSQYGQQHAPRDYSDLMDFPH